MVASVEKPEYSTIDVINNIIKSRKKFKKFYENLEEDWIEQADLYVEYGGDPSKIKPLDISLYIDNNADVSKRESTLVNLYSPKKEEELYNILDSMRRDHNLLVCPSCGNSGAPGTLDHYLPKDVFSELAIVLENLTPMCSDCQGSKGTKYLSDTGQKKYIHPYFDRIDEPVIELTILPPYETPVFKISVCEGLDGPLATLVYEHINGIEYEIRYKRFCKAKYIALLRQASRCRMKDKNNLIKLLTNRLEEEVDEKSINCWEAIFGRSVLNNRSLLEYLLDGTLPKKP